MQASCRHRQLHSGRWWAGAGQQQQARLDWQVWPAGQLASLRRSSRQGSSARQQGDAARKGSMHSMHPPRGATKGQKEPSSSFFSAGVEPAAAWPVLSVCNQCLNLHLSTHEPVAITPHAPPGPSHPCQGCAPAAVRTLWRGRWPLGASGPAGQQWTRPASPPPPWHCTADVAGRSCQQSFPPVTLRHAAGQPSSMDSICSVLALPLEIPSRESHLLPGSRKVSVLGLPREGQVPVPLAINVALLGGVGAQIQDGHSGLNSCGGRARLQYLSLHTWPCIVREGCALRHAAVNASGPVTVAGNVHPLLLPRHSPGLARPQHTLSIKAAAPCRLQQSRQTRLPSRRSG